VHGSATAWFWLSLFHPILCRKDVFSFCFLWCKTFTMDLLPDDHLYGEFLPMNKFEIGALSRHDYNLFLRQNAISYDLRLHLAEIRRVHQYKVL
jgi:hypothetical protein